MAKKQEQPLVQGGFGALRLLSSAFGSLRQRLANVSGKTFDNNRDLYKALGYKRELDLQDLRSRYMRNEIANRVVKMLPNATWRGGAEIWEDQDPNVNTPFEEAFIELDDRLHIWDSFRKADILSRIYHYSVILIGAPGDLDQPLTNVTADEIVYLQVYGELDAKIQMFEIDNKNERFGLPVFYQINRTQMASAASINTSSTARRVHWTRVFHVTDDLLEDRLFSDPALLCVWNRLDDLDKVAGGGTEAFWKRADQGMLFDVEETQDISDDDKKGFEAQMNDYEHRLKRYLLTRGITPHQLGSDVAPINDPVMTIISLICAGTGIPQRVLMGSEQGKLAAKTDRGNWDDKVSDRREQYADPLVARPFINYLTQLGALPEPAQRYEIRFPELKILDDQQRAEVAGQWSALNQQNQPMVVSRDEIRTRVLGLPTWEEANPNDDGMPAPAAKNPVGLAGKGGAPWTHVHKAADRFRGTDALERKRRFFRGPTSTRKGGA